MLNETPQVMKKLSYFVLLIILGATSFIPIACCGQSKQKRVHKLLYVIGDSLFDPGNNRYLNTSKKLRQSYYPYGISFHNHSTGRVSDGLIVPDFIALFAKLHFISPFLEPGAKFTYGASFASAGSGCLENHPKALRHINLHKQVTNFKRLAKLYRKEVLMGSVFLFSREGNDYFDFNADNKNATQADRKKFKQMVIGNLTKAIEDIYGLGGRKFAFQNVGPLSCLPMIKQNYPELKGSCNKKFLLHAKMHNIALSIALEKLENNLNGFKYAIFDYYTALRKRINDAPKYGFKQGKTACCGNGQYNGKNCGGGDSGTEAYNLCKNPSEYVFFDGGHTTEATNLQLAKLLWSGAPSVTGPHNVKQLFQLP